MRDPHVVALHYRLETGPQLTFSSAPAVEYEADAFSLRLADGHLRVELNDYFPTEEAARPEVEPYLRSWEIATDIQEGPGAISFVFERGEVIDRDPLAPEKSLTIQPLSGEIVSTGEHVVARVPRVQYPGPPAKFTASPEVIIMWSRYQGYKEGREPLPAMAQFCLTTIEQSVGGKQARKGAAARYAIDVEVLRRLGLLTSEVGDAQMARKRVAGRTLRPHTPAEVAWMEAVVKRLIQRVGEWAADRQAPWPRITMEDLPPL